MCSPAMAVVPWQRERWGVSPGGEKKLGLIRVVPVQEGKKVRIPRGIAICGASSFGGRNAPLNADAMASYVTYIRN